MSYYTVLSMLESIGWYWSMIYVMQYIHTLPGSLYFTLEVPELRLLHTVLSFVEYCWPDINSDFKQHES